MGDSEECNKECVYGRLWGGYQQLHFGVVKLLGLLHFQVEMSSGRKEVQAAYGMVKNLKAQH